jgi:hypothetical protein
MSDEVINPHEVLAEGKRPRGRPKGKAKANRRLKAIAMIEKDKEEALIAKLKAEREHKAILFREKQKQRDLEKREKEQLDLERKEIRTRKEREMVREVARMSYLERIPVLAAIIDADSSSNRDKISAMSELGKVSGLYQMDITSDGQKIEPTAIMVKFVKAPLLNDDDPIDEEDAIDAEYNAQD